MKQKNSNGLYVSFDIGSVSIKAVVLEINDTGQRLVSIEEEALKPLSEFPGEEEYRQQQIESLKKLATRLPLNEARRVSALFAHRELQIKILDLPSQVQQDQIDKILNWEAKKLLSPNFREEPYSYSYRIIRQNPFSVALTVIPQPLLERFTNLFESAGIPLDGSYSEVFAAHSLKEIIDISGVPALSIVNIGQTGTHLVIFAAGELRFYRFIPSGLSEMSVPPTNNELEMYSQKIRFSFDYFRAVSKLNQIDCLYFMGGGAAQPDLLPFERGYFNPTRINIVDISSGIDISPLMPDLAENTPAEEKQRRLLPFLPATGALLADISPESKGMNLSAQLRSKKRARRIQELARMMPLWLGIIGAIIAIAVLVFMKNQINAELSDLDKRLERAGHDHEAISIKIAKYRAAADTGIKMSPAFKKALEPMLKSRLTIAQALYLISQSKPENLAISEILVRNAAEAENIILEGSNDQEPIEGMDTETNPEAPFQSRYYSDNNDIEQLREGLNGKILIIRGTTPSHEELGKFSENLAKKMVMGHFKTIQVKKIGKAGLEFLLKGEMP